jgi:hypothetical protein
MPGSTRIGSKTRIGVGAVENKFDPITWIGKRNGLSAANCACASKALWRVATTLVETQLQL